MLISSRDNPIIKETGALVRSRHAREDNGRYVVEGARLCAEAARGGATVLRLFYTSFAAEKYASYMTELRKIAREEYEITHSVAEKLCDTTCPQGIFIVCEIPGPSLVLDGDGLFVLLAGLQDPGNIGSIFRTCEAMNVRGVLICSSVDIFAPKLVRASMGSLFRLPIASFETIEEGLLLLSDAGCETYATALSENAQALPQVRFAKKSALVIGNEGSGLPPEIISACSHTVMIPMPGRAESLNVASATAIMIYSATQQNA